MSADEDVAEEDLEEDWLEDNNDEANDEFEYGIYACDAVHEGDEGDEGDDIGDATESALRELADDESLDHLFERGRQHSTAHQ